MNTYKNNVQKRDVTVTQRKHAKKLITIEITKEDWEKYSLWGRFGMRVGQAIGLIEIEFINAQ